MSAVERVSALLANPAVNESVYALIREAGTDVYTNALIWRCVKAALTAAAPIVHGEGYAERPLYARDGTGNPPVPNPYDDLPVPTGDWTLPGSPTAGCVGAGAS